MLRTIAGYFTGFFVACMMFAMVINPDLTLVASIIAILMTIVLFVWSDSHHKRKRKDYYDRFRFTPKEK